MHPIFIVFPFSHFQGMSAAGKLVHSQGGLQPALLA